MSQGPWKINEGSFLCQVTFTCYTCFLLKTQTPHWSRWPRAGEMWLRLGGACVSKLKGFLEGRGGLAGFESGQSASGKRVNLGTQPWGDVSSGPWRWSRAGVLLFPGGLASKPRARAQQDRALKDWASGAVVASTLQELFGTLSLAPERARVVFGSRSNWKLHQGKRHVGHVLEELTG